MLFKSHLDPHQNTYPCLYYPRIDVLNCREKRDLFFGPSLIPFAKSWQAPVWATGIIMA